MCKKVVKLQNCYQTKLNVGNKSKCFKNGDILVKMCLPLMNLVVGQTLLKKALIWLGDVSGFAVFGFDGTWGLGGTDEILNCVVADYL